MRLFTQVQQVRALGAGLSRAALLLWVGSSVATVPTGDGWRPWMEGDLVKGRERGSALFASAQPVETAAPHQLSDKKGNSTDARRGGITDGASFHHLRCSQQNNHCEPPRVHVNCWTAQKRLKGHFKSEAADRIIGWHLCARLWPHDLNA